MLGHVRPGDIRLDQIKPGWAIYYMLGAIRPGLARLGLVGEFR